MGSQKVTFQGHNGHMLAGRLDLPHGQWRAAALFAHCFTCSKDILAAKRIANRLCALGLAVFRFDFTGLGHSEGEFSNTDFSSNVDDLVLAARWMDASGMPPQMLIGHSLGGAAVLQARGTIPSIQAVVTIGAPFEPAHVLHHFESELPTIEAHGSTVVSLGGREFEIQQSFIDDITGASVTEALAQLKAALLVMHAPTDNVVGIDNAASIYQAAMHPKSFVSLDHADHLLTQAKDAEYVAEVIASWSRRYLPAEEEAEDASVPEGITRVSETGQGFQQDISMANGIALIADEPKTLGGLGTGPSPYQLLCAGLGACTTMTIRMYANRKKIPLTHVSCDVQHGKCHLSDSGRADETAGRIDVFQRLIQLHGDLDTEQRNTLLEIADKCPVHKTLHQVAHIETRLVSDATEDQLNPG